MSKNNRALYLDRKEKADLYRICRANQLSCNMSKGIVSQLAIWELEHGIHWVVDRLKLYVTDLKTRAEAIRKHPDGSWHGQFHSIYVLAHRGSQGFFKALKILKVYGRWRLREPSLQNALDIKKLIETPDIPNGVFHKYYAQIIGCLSSSDLYLARSAGEQAVFQKTYPLGNKRSPVMGLMTKKRVLISPKEHIDAFRAHCGPMAVDWHPFISRVIYYEKPVDIAPGTNIVGVVSMLTKDGGLKVRQIANPFMVIQMALSRLKDACRIFNESLPESCVFNADRGERWIVEQLNAGYSLSSIDLTSCSDLLSGRLQFAILRYLFPNLHEDIDFFEDVSHSYFLIKFKGGTLPVRWIRGQPLGEDPSFFSFSDTLVLLIRSVGGTVDQFRTYGDDLIMRSELEAPLLKAFDELNVIVSSSKSIFNSAYIAEFVGRVITRKGNMGVYKARKFNIKNDPLGMIRQYGPAGLRLIPKKYRNFVGRLALLPPPVGFGKNTGDIPEDVFMQSLFDVPKPISVKVYPRFLYDQFSYSEFSDLSKFRPLSNEWQDHSERNFRASRRIRKLIEQNISGAEHTSNEPIHEGLGSWMLEFVDSFNEENTFKKMSLKALNPALTKLSRDVKTELKTEGTLSLETRKLTHAARILHEQVFHLEGEKETEEISPSDLKGKPKQSFLSKIYNKLKTYMRKIIFHKDM